ncbi:MAG: hypothetical protein Q9225_007672 [Loekoesia sp. 1 TL-2023]
MTSQSNPDDGLRCSKCGMGFLFPGSKELHLEFSACRFTCKLCDNIFHSDLDLKGHWKTAHARLYCSICEKVCISRRAKAFHDHHKHFRCGPCNRMFGSKEEWEYHHQTHIHIRYCSICHCFIRDIDGQWPKHKKECFTQKHDEEGSRPNTSTGTEEDDSPKGKKKEHAKSKENSRPAAAKSIPDGVPDFYGYLNTHPLSSHEDIIQAARKRRVEVHPDKLKKSGMTDEELRKIDQTAKQVGWAADILLDPAKRAKYDMELRGHMRSRR